MMHKEYRI